MKMLLILHSSPHMSSSLLKNQLQGQMSVKKHPSIEALTRVEPQADGNITASLSSDPQRLTCRISQCCV